MLLRTILGVVTFLCLQLLTDCKSNEPSYVVEQADTAERILVDSSITLNFLMGKFAPETDSEFVKVPEQYANRPGHYLQKDTWEAFLRMYNQARQDSIDLKVISSTRNFDIQKSIWEAKWTGERKVENGMDLSKDVSDPVERAKIILRYSSMPSTSRHHWGTDLDINALNNGYFSEGRGLKEYNWLLSNAHTYGFCQPYTAKDENRPNGYNEEKWHWSYIPLASQYTEQAALRLTNNMISGFLGAEVATDIGVIDNYILGINKDCL